MLDEIIKRATSGLDGVISELISAATGKLKKKISDIFTLRKIGKIKEKISNVGFVKTILHPDAIIELNKIYFPPAVAFQSGVTIESVSGFGSWKHVLIEGGPGQGKSLYLKHLCVTEGRGSTLIPIFIEFRHFDFEKPLKIEILDAIRSFAIDIDDESFDYLAKSNKIVLLLDGFDEIPSNTRLKAARDLEKIAKTYPDLRIIVTSRPNSGMGASVYFEKLKITPLSPALQVDFIRHIYSDSGQASETISVLRDSSFIAEVTSSPLLLTLFSITYNARQFRPDSIAEFYSVIFPTMLYRHDRMKLGYQREREACLTDYQMERIFEVLSFISLRDNNTRFSASEFRKYLEFASKIERINENLEDKIISDITDITALIIPDGYNQFSYAHKSIQEYFSAVFISRVDESKKQGFYNSAADSFIEYGKWHNVLVFLSIIDEQSYQRLYSVPLRRRLLGLHESRNIRITYGSASQFIGLDSRIKATENGEIIDSFWGDAYSSSIFPEYAKLAQDAAICFLTTQNSKIAEYISVCPLEKYEAMRHSDGDFIINIFDFIRSSGNQNKFSTYISNKFNESTAKSDVVLAEKRLKINDDLVRDILKFN